MITTEETIVNMADANAFNRWNTIIVKTINALIKDKKFMKLNEIDKVDIVLKTVAKENSVIRFKMNKEIKDLAKEHNISTKEIINEYKYILDDLVYTYTGKIKPTTKRIDRVVLVGVEGEDELCYGYYTAKEIRTLAKSHKVFYTACRVDLTIKDMGLEDIVIPDCLYEEVVETEEEISGMYIPEYDECVTEITIDGVTDSVTTRVTDSVTTRVTDSVTKGVTDSVTKVGDRFCNSIILLLQYYYTKLFTMKSEDFFFNLALLLSRLKIPINNTLFLQ